MAQSSTELDSTWMSASPPSYEQSMQLLHGNCTPVGCSNKVEVSLNPSLRCSASRKDFPIPPPLPGPAYNRCHLQNIFSVTHSCNRYPGYNCVPKGTVETWNKLFQEGYKADVQIFTYDGGVIPAHINVLGIASPVLKNLLKQQTVKSVKSRLRSFTIMGVPYDAARAFICFLYSSREHNGRADQLSKEAARLQLSTWQIEYMMEHGAYGYYHRPFHDI